MKLLSKLSVLAVVGITALISASIASANLLSISEKEINEYLQTRLAEKVRLQDQVGIPGLFQLNYHLRDLSTKIGQTSEKKVEIQGTVDGILVAKGKQREAQITLNLETTPYYDPEKGALFLKEVRLLSWQVLPEKYQSEIQMFLPLLADGLQGVLNNTPVYTLDESKTKEALVKKFGKAIVVEQGSLRLETGIF